MFNVDCVYATVELFHRTFGRRPTKLHLTYGAHQELMRIIPPYISPQITHQGVITILGMELVVIPERDRVPNDEVDYNTPYVTTFSPDSPRSHYSRPATSSDRYAPLRVPIPGGIGLEPDELSPYDARHEMWHVLPEQMLRRDETIHRVRQNALQRENPLFDARFFSPEGRHAFARMADRVDIQTLPPPTEIRVLHADGPSWIDEFERLAAPNQGQIPEAQAVPPDAWPSPAPVEIEPQPLVYAPDGADRGAVPQLNLETLQRARELLAAQSGYQGPVELRVTARVAEQLRHRGIHDTEAVRIVVYEPVPEDLPVTNPTPLSPH